MTFYVDKASGRIAQAFQYMWCENNTPLFANPPDDIIGLFQYGLLTCDFDDDKPLSADAILYDEAGEVIPEGAFIINPPAHNDFLEYYPRSEFFTRFKKITRIHGDLVPQFLRFYGFWYDKHTGEWSIQDFKGNSLEYRLSYRETTERMTIICVNNDFIIPPEHALENIQGLDTTLMCTVRDLLSVGFQFSTTKQGE